MENNNRPTMGNGKICYLQIPAFDINISVSFYKTVFGWHIRTRPDGNIAFDDGVGEVSGTWITDRPPATSAGIVIYIMVDDISAVVDSILLNGGKMTTAIEGIAPELTALFSDPAGNIMGISQQ